MTTTCSNVGNAKVKHSLRWSWTQTMCSLVVMFSNGFLLSMILVTWLANQGVAKMQSQHASQRHGMLFDCSCLFAPTMASAWKSVAISLNLWVRKVLMAVRHGQGHVKVSAAWPLLTVGWCVGFVVFVSSRISQPKTFIEDWLSTVFRMRPSGLGCNISGTCRMGKSVWPRRVDQVTVHRFCAKLNSRN